MSNQLFTEVSAEQQEIVAGGLVVAGVNTTNIFGQLTQAGTTSSAGPNGASSSAGFTSINFALSQLNAGLVTTP